MSDAFTFLGERIEVERDGEEIVVWNKVSVVQRHEVEATRVETSHDIRVGDGILDESPDHITPEIDRQLERLDVYPDAEVVDPRDEEVTVL